MELALVWLHVVGNLVWLGSILAVGAALAIPSVDLATRGQVALTLYRRVATPGFLLSFVCGVMRLAVAPRYYFVEHHWMHGKLTFALAVIALHHVIGARARRMAGGDARGSGRIAALTAALAVSAAAAAFFAVFRMPN